MWDPTTTKWNQEFEKFSYAVQNCVGRWQDELVEFHEEKERKWIPEITKNSKGNWDELEQTAVDKILALLKEEEWEEMLAVIDDCYWY